MTVISGRRPLSSLPFDEAPLHHAHPHPQNRKPNSSQQIRELLRTIHVDLRLRGLPGANTSKVTDLYCPEVRRSMPMRNRHINHLDVVSCWKGLSFRRASEVLLWEDLFRHSLESQVRDTLLHNLAEHLSHRHGGRSVPRYECLDKPSLISYLIDSISSKRSRMIAIDASKLVYDMIEKYHETDAYHELDWFKSSKNLPAAVYNFARTRDCFLDSFPLPSLEVSFSYKPIPTGLTILGDVNWNPPNVSFPNLPIRLRCGAEYRISPQYNAPDLGSEYGAKFSKYIMEPVYSITSMKLPLAWNSNLRCFLSTVPSVAKQQPFRVERANGSTKKTKIADTRFEAKVVMNFPDSVRFEQTTRYDIKLEIDPSIRRSSTSSVRAYAFEFDEDESLAEEYFSFHPSPRSNEHPDDPLKDRVAALPRTAPWMLSNASTPMSKGGISSTYENMPPNSSDDEDIDSPNTSSVERCADRCIPYFAMLFQSRKHSLLSCGKFTDEVASQVDGLDQNRDPGWGADEKGEVDTKDTGYDADYDSMEPLLPNRSVSPKNEDESSDEKMDASIDAILHGDPGPKYITDGNSSVHWEKRAHAEIPTVATFGRLQAERSHASIQSHNKKALETLEELEGQEHFRKRGRRHVNKGKASDSSSSPLRDVDSNEASNGGPVPQKRKAVKHVSGDQVSFHTPSAFDAGRLALDRFQHVDLEIAAKRQRVSKRVDSGIYMRDVAECDTDEGWDDDHWSHEPASNLDRVTTGRLGEALRVPSAPSNSPGWFEKLKDGHDDVEASTRSRAYEANFASSKVMPALKKKGSVKRMVFLRHKNMKGGLQTELLPTPSASGPSSSETSPVDDESCSIDRNRVSQVDGGFCVDRYARDQDDVRKFETGVGEDEFVKACNELLGRYPEIRGDVKKPELCLDQTEIIKSYNGFLEQKQKVVTTANTTSAGRQDALNGTDEEDCKAFEKAFLNDSPGNSEVGWDTDPDLTDLSVGLETVSLHGEME